MRMFVSIIVGVLLAVAGSARAHIAEGTVTLTAADEVPKPTGVPSNAGGAAELTLGDDKILTYELTVQNLTGSADAAHIHDGLPGVAGGIVFALTKTSGTSFAGKTTALSDDQVAKLLTGGFYMNVHTPDNPAGEIRGQIFTGKCSCTGAADKRAFLSCVKDEIKALEKEQKKIPAIKAALKAMKKANKKALCGSAIPPKKKQTACCLTPAASFIVSESLCQPVKKDTQCKGGTFVNEPCAKDTCAPGSPSGAFIE